MPGIDGPWHVERVSEERDDVLGGGSQGVPVPSTSTNGGHDPDWGLPRFDGLVGDTDAPGRSSGPDFGCTGTAGRSIEDDGVFASRVADGRLVESTDVWDAFGLFAHLGTFPEVM